MQRSSGSSLRCCAVFVQSENRVSISPEGKRRCEELRRTWKVPVAGQLLKLGKRFKSCRRNGKNHQPAPNFVTGPGVRAGSMNVLL